MSPVTFPPGIKDELGTEKLFKSMLGKVYTVRGFDKSKGAARAARSSEDQITSSLDLREVLRRDCSEHTRSHHAGAVTVALPDAASVTG
jgi:hypothetical protein